MMKSMKQNIRDRLTSSRSLAVQHAFIAIILSACGSKKVETDSEDILTGFSPEYKAPVANYREPELVDLDFKRYEPSYVDPYWVDSLLMHNGTNVVRHILRENESTIYYSFASEKPTYIPLEILGWAPASDDMIDATREIFSMVKLVLNVEFQESQDIKGVNVVNISQSIQASTAGLSYLPNTFYEIGSDLFISKNFSSPEFIKNELTNYDYEVLLHELGHALGLKHPFEPDGDNLVVLSEAEDHTGNTAMSYNDYANTFDGTFRALDWMSLTKLYGVNPEYQSEDNTYNFSASNGVFIIDGEGIDSIICKDSALDVFVDLRPGAHSYEGEKTSQITSPRQLTISHGSDVENVQTGSGNDIIVGNNLDNQINTSSGNDVIFAGNGVDIVDPGAGDNIIDLSEDTNSKDLLIFEISVAKGHTNLVYGFSQGAQGDVIEFREFGSQVLNFLPLVDFQNAPIGYIDDSLIRVFGENIDSANIAETYFNGEGSLKNLKLSQGNSALLISAGSQKTGENQTLCYLKNHLGHVEVSLLVQFIGNYLDIDQWSAENFLV